MVINDTDCHYRDQGSLNNTKLLQTGWYRCLCIVYPPHLQRIIYVIVVVVGFSVMFYPWHCYV